MVKIFDHSNKIKKLEKKNKIKKAFNGKEKAVEISGANAKDVFLDLFTNKTI